jgi:hypothetical protein
MTNVILERAYDEPITVADFAEMASQNAGCLDLHGVDWRQSLLSASGADLVCWFSAADLESIRIALRTSGIDLCDIWRGTVHDAPDVDAEDLAQANVLVSRQFEEPVQLEDVQAIEDAGAGCLEVRDVKFVRTFFSTDRKRMLCLYRAPDVESVRQAQREAKMPFAEVWSVESIQPETLAAGA